jgi:hypothetical protein
MLIIFLPSERIELPIQLYKSRVMPFNYEGALDVFIFFFFLVFPVLLIGFLFCTKKRKRKKTRTLEKMLFPKENEEKISDIVLDQPLGESNPFSLREG